MRCVLLLMKRETMVDPRTWWGEVIVGGGTRGGARGTGPKSYQLHSFHSHFSLFIIHQHLPDGLAAELPKLVILAHHQRDNSLQQISGVVEMMQCRQHAAHTSGCHPCFCCRLGCFPLAATNGMQQKLEVGLRASKHTSGVC